MNYQYRWTVDISTYYIFTTSINLNTKHQFLIITKHKAYYCALELPVSKLVLGFNYRYILSMDHKAKKLSKGLHNLFIISICSIHLITLVRKKYIFWTFDFMHLCCAEMTKQKKYFGFYLDTQKRGTQKCEVKFWDFGVGRNTVHKKGGSVLLEETLL